MPETTQLSPEDLERYRRYKAERAAAATALQQAQQAFAAAEAKYQGQSAVIEAEYDYNPIEDEIGDDGVILKGITSEQTRANRRALRDRRLRRPGTL